MKIRDRMASIQLFTDSDDNYPEESIELARERQRGKALCHEINTLHPDKVDERHALLGQLLGGMGENVWMEAPIRVAYGCNITMGNNVYINFNLTIIDDYTVTIGSNVLFGPNVTISATNHPVHPDLRKYMYALPVVIGDHVWIGSGAIIAPGVTIGRGCVIGAGSVVVKDVPPNSIAVGNPCKPVREITDRDREYYYKDMRVDQVEW